MGEKCDFFENDPESHQKHFPSKNRDLKENLMIFKINGAKHSPLPSPLARPPAGFGGPRATAFFGPFDPILVADIIHRMRNPQTFLENYLRTLISLNMSSIGQREDLGLLGNV